MSSDLTPAKCATCSGPIIPAHSQLRNDKHHCHRCMCPNRSCKAIVQRNQELCYKCNARIDPAARARECFLLEEQHARSKAAAPSLTHSSTSPALPDAAPPPAPTPPAPSKKRAREHDGEECERPAKRSRTSARKPSKRIRLRFSGTGPAKGLEVFQTVAADGSGLSDVSLEELRLLEGNRKNFACFYSRGGG